MGHNGDLANWRARGGYSFPVLFAESPDYARVNYNISETPTNLFLNADGKMVLRDSGFLPGKERTLEAQLRELLGLR